MCYKMADSATFLDSKQSHGSGKQPLASHVPLFIAMYIFCSVTAQTASLHENGDELIEGDYCNHDTTLYR